jgi:hypothetical protein
MDLTRGEIETFFSLYEKVEERSKEVVKEYMSAYGWKTFKVGDIEEISPSTTYLIVGIEDPRCYDNNTTILITMENLLDPNVFSTFQKERKRIAEETIAKELEKQRQEKEERKKQQETHDKREWERLKRKFGAE